MEDILKYIIDNKETSIYTSILLLTLGCLLRYFAGSIKSHIFNVGHKLTSIESKLFELDKEIAVNTTKIKSIERAVNNQNQSKHNKDKSLRELIEMVVDNNK